MTVFVVQKQMRLVDGKLVPRFTSINRARKYGDLHYLLPASAHPYEPERVLGDLHLELENFSERDFLLLVGNPVLMSMAFAVATHYSGGGITVLQWSKEDYVPIKMAVY